MPTNHLEQAIFQTGTILELAPFSKFHRLLRIFFSNFFTHHPWLHILQLSIVANGGKNKTDTIQARLERHLLAFKALDAFFPVHATTATTPAKTTTTASTTTVTKATTAASSSAKATTVAETSTAASSSTKATTATSVT
jgi:hypothetical protein